MITIKEIAKLAGVSPKTAERALSGVTKDKRKDARERAEKIRALAKKYNFCPSEVARSLRRGSSHTIGFLLDILTDQFLAAAVETAMEEAALHQYRISLKIAKFDPEQTEAAIKNLLSSRVDGIITSCIGTQMPSKIIKSMEKNKFPLLFLCGRTPFEKSSVSYDYTQALPEAVHFLAQKGHRKITFCLFMGKDKSNETNSRIFLDACEKEGIKPDLRIHQDKFQAAALADERIPALILYGKYSMRIYQDRCRELSWQSDTVGIYNEWTYAGAKRFPLCGIILEPAEKAVRTAVLQIIAEIRGENYCHHNLAAAFIPQDALQSLKVPDLANQTLHQDF